MIMAIEAKTTLLRRMEMELADKLTQTDLAKVLEALSDQLPGFQVEQNDPDNGDDDMLDAYLNAKAIEGRSPLTLDRYRRAITKLMATVKVSTREITVYHIRRYLSEEKARGISDRTLEGVRQIFSAYFNWLQREGLITGNPGANLGAIRCAKKIVETFSDVEMEMLRSSCRNARERALVAFLGSTGCRVSEVCGLNREDLDIAGQMCKVHGKGNKDRLVYFDSVTAMLLARYLMTRTDDHPALFVNDKRKSRIEPGGVRWILHDLEARSGVDHVHPHRFRRTCATKLISRGMSIQNVARILGHDKLETTMKYIKLDDHAVHNAFDLCS